MIRGQKRLELTPETLFQRITQYDIFRFYMPNKDWKINQVTRSPFHEDKDPSFLIGNRGGNLTFIDFANTAWKGDCFTFVKLLYGLSSMNDVLMMIDKDFGLGLVNQSTNTSVYKQIKAEYKQPEELGKRYANVQVITKPFLKEELTYWGEYHQDIQDLRDNNIFSIKRVYLNKQIFSMKETDLRFGYYYDGHWKIYRPYVDKKVKWVPNNVPIYTMEGLENIKGCEYSFINKSKKDYMVVKKLLESTCAVQNEGIGCFTVENVKYLKENSKRQILSFDSDITGVANSQQITKMFDFDYCNVPREYLVHGIKDWADLAKKYGMAVVEKIFQSKGLI
jgi:DNA primase